MLKHARWAVLAVVASSLLFACSDEKLDLTVKVRMEGKPVAQARVTVDKKEQGFTDADGVFARVLKKKPGAVVEIVVVKEIPGYRIKPWKTTFPMKHPSSGNLGVAVVEADLQALHTVTIVAIDKNGPVPDAVVKARGIAAGKTDAQGTFVYEYKDRPKEGLELEVTKPGYAAWRKTGPVEPAQRIEALLAKRVTVLVSALMEEYGQSIPLPGIAVSIDSKAAGTTDARGLLVYAHEGTQGGTVPLVLSARGYLPETWRTSIVLEGDVSVQRYFTPTAPRPVRTGIYRFAGNTPDTDQKDMLVRIEAAVAAQLFKNTCFREVPTSTLRSEMKLAKLNIDTITTKGWLGAPLKKTVDVIILGSVARDNKGFLIETRFHTAGGNLILSRITRAKSAGDIHSTARDIANAALEQFPFEGTIVSAEGDRYRLNLGKAGYKIATGTVFTVMMPRLDENGKVSGFRETGRLQVKKAEENGSWSEIVDLKQGEKISVGDRVVRRFSRDGEEEDAHDYFLLSVKGGLWPDVAPLPAVNIYVNEEWLGTTGPDGTAEVPVPLGKNVTFLLYRHGYQHLTGTVKIEKNRDTREFTLLVNTALFRVDSEPRSAAVFVDGEMIGRTPILDGKPVNLGFHRVKVSLGGDYRDWEEVVEFSKKEESRVGKARIILHKDCLRIGERAEQKGDLEAAILSYKSAGKGHPDFITAHHRLARIYLDEKNDYDGAIREFEIVLATPGEPGDRHLVSKQFAAAFMNLGHAYYEKGIALEQTDQKAAAKNFAKAIQNLEVAKQNVRFFPNDHYDEAVHDTYYYTALSQHKLYELTGKSGNQNSANRAWREYFDSFPRKLEGESAYEQARERARKYRNQIKNR